MQGNRSRDTAPEIAVRQLVHAAGLRYLVSARPEPDIRRTADLVFRGPRIAVFLDGCYWHGCPAHFKPPKTNVEFWSAKIARNIERDMQTNRLLSECGWTVMRFWNHEPLTDVVDTIVAKVRASPRSGTSRAGA